MRDITKVKHCDTIALSDCLRGLFMFIISAMLILYHIFWLISTRQFGIFNVVFNRMLNFSLHGALFTLYAIKHLTFFFV